MQRSKVEHRRHHSASASHILKNFQRTESSDSMLLRGAGTSPENFHAAGGRRRPGSDSDILEAKSSGASLQHQDSLMLAYHQRPSVIAGHSANTAANVPVRQTKPVYVWTQTEVCKWLKRHIPQTQAHYADLFAHHDITGKTLLMLNDTKLMRMGVSDSGHRHNIQNEILKLQMKNYMQCFKGLQSAGMFDIQ
ncbi:protein aveugle-like [Clavelina lepadiformis]|uniref:protein aveugle-like n=1 Tax=Clavelina lepadiformis TaxID=159417 RepID=UPI004041505F